MAQDEAKPNTLNTGCDTVRVNRKHYKYAASHRTRRKEQTGDQDRQGEAKEGDTKRETRKQLRKTRHRGRERETRQVGENIHDCT